MIKKFYMRVLTAFLTVLLFVSGCTAAEGDMQSYTRESIAKTVSESGEIPDTPYIVLNNNMPTFSEDEITTVSFEEYSELDELGRCGTAFACVGTDLMPTEERGAIGQVKPTGWHTVKYDCVDGKYLYNRCHLIGYQLSGENANNKNLVTGTRYLNTVGMLPFENEVAEYVKETGNHVMYRVTPDFEGENLLINGVQMEAWSVEDNGEGICFNVFVYNVQPGITIDYATGESAEGTESITEKTSKEDVSNTESADGEEMGEYILNKNTMKFHLPSCSSAESIKINNKESYEGSRTWLIENGYEPCQMCKP